LVDGQAKEPVALPIEARVKRGFACVWVKGTFIDVVAQGKLMIAPGLARGKIRVAASIVDGT
jgi:hypothetical protein